MYHYITGCSTLIYLLAKHPILIVALGLAGAVAYLHGPTDKPRIAGAPASTVEELEEELDEEGLSEAEVEIEHFEEKEDLMTGEREE